MVHLMQTYVLLALRLFSLIQAHTGGLLQFPVDGDWRNAGNNQVLQHWLTQFQPLCSLWGAIGISGCLIWSKILMQLIFNPCGEFRWSPECPVSQIYSPRLHAGVPGIFSDLLTILVSSASSVSSLKIASADRLQRDLYEIFILY